MKSYGVTIHMKPLQQYFHTVLYFYYVVLTFHAVDQILWCNQAKKVVLSIMVPYIKYAVRFFQPMVMDKASTETFSTTLFVFHQLDVCLDSALGHNWE